MNDKWLKITINVPRDLQEAVKEFIQLSADFISNYNIDCAVFSSKYYGKIWENKEVNIYFTPEFQLININELLVDYNIEFCEAPTKYVEDILGVIACPVSGKYWNYGWESIQPVFLFKKFNEDNKI